jgi:hypothetical protein
LGVSSMEGPTMATDDDMRAMVQNILIGSVPRIVESMGEMATKPETSATNRLHAVEILLRIAPGPSGRPSEDTDIVAADNARTALSRAVPFLVEIVNSHTSARIRARARKLAGRIGNLDP